MWGRQECRPYVGDLITISGPRADAPVGAIRSNASRPFSGEPCYNVNKFSLTGITKTKGRHVRLVLGYVDNLHRAPFDGFRGLAALPWAERIGRLGSNRPSRSVRGIRESR